MRPHLVLNKHQNLIECHLRRVNPNGIRRRLQRRIRPVPVALIALAQLPRQHRTSLRRIGISPRAVHRRHLLKPPLAARLRRSIQKKLQVRIGKNHRPNIAPFHHHAPPAPQRPLQPHHPFPNRRMHAHPRSRLRHLRITNPPRNFDTIQQHAVPALNRLQCDRSLRRQPFQRLRVVHIHAALQRLQRKRPIHCARLQVQKTKVLRQMLRNRALPRARRPVNGNNAASLRHCSPSSLLRLRNGGLNPPGFGLPGAGFPDLPAAPADFPNGLLDFPNGLADFPKPAFLKPGPPSLLNPGLPPLLKAGLPDFPKPRPPLFENPPPTRFVGPSRSPVCDPRCRSSPPAFAGRSRKKGRFSPGFPVPTDLPPRRSPPRSSSLLGRNGRSPSPPERVPRCHGLGPPLPNFFGANFPPPPPLDGLSRSKGRAPNGRPDFSNGFFPYGLRSPSPGLRSGRVSPREPGCAGPRSWRSRHGRSLSAPNFRFGKFPPPPARS